MYRKKEVFLFLLTSQGTHRAMRKRDLEFRECVREIERGRKGSVCACVCGLRTGSKCQLEKCLGSDQRCLNSQSRQFKD